MNSLLDLKRVAYTAPLQKAHYPFPRAQELREAVSVCLTDYYTKAMSGGALEARGVLVAGGSRVGKSRKLRRLIAEINSSEMEMPSGHPPRFVSCNLRGKVTWKDLGIRTLEALNYPCNQNRSQNYIWDMVTSQAKRQGVIGIHYDECQHIFTDTGAATNRTVLDSFKAVLKEPAWPMMLILSGVPELAQHIQKEKASEERRQLSYLLRPVHFGMIDLNHDFAELNGLAFSYADKAGVDFEDLSNADFLRRLAFACAYRWGLVIEMVIEAFVACLLAGDSKVSMGHFETAFWRIHGGTKGFTPFSLDDYEEAFDPEKLLENLSQED